MRSWRRLAARLNPGRSRQLSFVLTLALGETGRPGNDLERAAILMDSCVRFVDPADVGAFLVCSPAGNLAEVRRGLSAYERHFPLEFLAESTVAPVLASDPDTRSDWPKPNKGWYRQQLIKLAAHAFVSTPFYMTLDSDVIFKRPLRARQLLGAGRSPVNVETHALYRSLYLPEKADFERRIRLERYEDAERVLKLARPPERRESWYGETPVVLSRRLVRRLAAHIERVWRQPWQAALLRALPWTEYPLYFVYAEATGALDAFHVPGGPDSVSNLAQSLWLEARDYRDGRNLHTWPVDAVFDPRSPGFAVVVQSYLGLDPLDVRRRVGRFLEGPANP